VEYFHQEKKGIVEECKKKNMRMEEKKMRNGMV
jgi:hypothetical protein